MCGNAEIETIWRGLLLQNYIGLYCYKLVKKQNSLRKVNANNKVFSAAVVQLESWKSYLDCCQLSRMMSLLLNICLTLC
jgi:hypothetical protein